MNEMVPCGLTEDERAGGIGVMSSMERLIPLLLLRLPTYRIKDLTDHNKPPKPLTRKINHEFNTSHELYISLLYL